MNILNEEQLSPKELAWLLHRHVNYVYLMRRAGFPMPSYRASLADAQAWLDKNPNWRTEFEKRRGKRT